jgi:hypothetical protein
LAGAARLLGKGWTIYNYYPVQDWYGTVQPSRLAAGCLAGAARLLGKGWTSELSEVTGYSSIVKLADISR